MIKKTPGRKTQSSAFRKRQLSSDAKIISALLKKQPQTKQEIIENTNISDRTLYRNLPLLEKNQIIKRVDQRFALWGFDVLEESIEAAFTKMLMKKSTIPYSFMVNQIGKPWRDIEAASFKIAKKLGLIISFEEGQPVFVKIE
jgi:hypothetical protein